MRHLRNRIKNPELVRIEIVVENFSIYNYADFRDWCCDGSYAMYAADVEIGNAETNDSIMKYDEDSQLLYVNYQSSSFDKIFNLIDYFFQPEQPTFYIVYFTDYEFIRANAHFDIQEYFISNDYGQKYFKRVWGYWSYDNCGGLYDTEPTSERFGFGQTGVYLDYKDEQNDETKLYVKYYSDKRSIFDEDFKSPFWKNGQWNN